MSEFGDGLPAGARIEEFEIVRELGRGGFGITYLARDHALHRLVAVKEYYPVDWSMRQAGGSIGPRSTTMAADYAWGLEKFVAEARVLARLDHPGIVKVHRIVEAGGSAYIAMEHIDGHSLADELLNSGPLPVPQVRRLLQRLAEGLAEVHAAGLLHRDVKPANVMLRARDGSPVLIDFGAARQQMGQQSRSITTILTPGYAPIEQYSKRGRQGPWTDVYALGAVGYAALSGRAPDDATERTMEDRLPPVDAVAASPVSGELAGAVMAALATDLRERPQDMAEWMAMLGAASESVPAFEANGAIGDPPGDGAEDETADVGLSGVDGQPDVVLTEASGKAVLARKSGRGAFPGWLWGAMAAVVVVAVGLTLWLRGGNAEQDEAALGLSVEDRVLVQRGLVEVGHDPGESDGLFGAGTREGLRTWQESRGLEATGFLTAPVADVLLRAAALADSLQQEEALAQAVADSVRQVEAALQESTAAAAAVAEGERERREAAEAEAAEAESRLRIAEAQLAMQSRRQATEDARRSAGTDSPRANTYEEHVRLGSPRLMGDRVSFVRLRLIHRLEAR